MTWQISSTWPAWLLAVVMATLLGALAFGVATMVRKQVKRSWVIGLALLRVAAFVVFALGVLQPTLTWSRWVPPRPVLAILLDTSHSMADHWPAALAQLQTGDMAGALEQRYQIRWFNFDETARPTTRAALAGLKADGATTRLARSLEEACELLHAEGDAAPRVLLVSDGLDHGGTDAAEIARRRGVVVDVLPPPRRRDAAADPARIVDVQGARRVLLGSETHFRVTLRDESGSADRKLTIQVLEDGKHLFDVPITLDKDQRERVVTLAHRPISSGTKQYGFALAEPGGAAAEPIRFPVQVIDGKYEVLVLEDVWRWEYKYLHRLFEDDPSFRFTALLARGGGAFTQFGSPDRRVNLVGFPQGQAELENFDLFFLGDVHPGRWPPRLAAGLARLVEEEGKSLVVIAGPNLAHFVDVPELHALLPVELVAASGKPVAGPVAARLRADASASPFFFQISPDQVENLPPLDQVYPPLRKRPGATVLVETAKHRNPHGPLIIVAEHTVGRGRVLFVGTDVLWKWHALAPPREGPTPHGLFWRQALRALTPERARHGAIDVWLRTSRTRAAVGENVELVAEVQSERPLSGAKVTAQAVPPDGQPMPLALAVDPAQPQRHRAVFAAVKAGLHALRAEVIVDGQRAATGEALLQVDESRGEASRGVVDHALLERLATMTGGRVVDPARSETWPTPEDAAALPVLETRTIAWWDNFTLVLILMALLGADWLFRLIKGLV